MTPPATEQHQILLASSNTGKLAELRHMLPDAVAVLGLGDIAPYDALPETGATFEENARIKAEQAVRETGLIALADDSGLEVDALRGMPGVLSARWAGRHGDDEANNALLLAQMADVPDERRGAAFITAVALAYPGGETVVRYGRWQGRIAHETRGSNGFGYDPLFVPAESDADGTGLASAELAPERKNELSHRGRAMALIVPEIRRILGIG